MRTLEQRYQRAEAFLPANALRQAYGWHITPRWINGSDRFWYRVHTRRGFEFIHVDPESGTRRPAFDHAALAAALEATLDLAVAPYALPFKTITYTSDETTVTFSVDDVVYAFDLISATLTAQSPEDLARLAAEHELSSPDGRLGAFVQDHNLFVRAFDTGVVTQLTTDGVPGFGYGEEPGGTMTAVTDAQSGLRTPPAACWSPDSRRLLVFRADERQVKHLHLIEHVPLDGSLRPALHSYPSPMVEDGDWRTIQYVLVDVTTRAVTPVAIEPLTGMESPFYFPRAGLRGFEFWSRDGARLFLPVRADGYCAQRLYEVDPATGAARLILEERAETPVLLNLFEFDRPNLWVLPDSDELIWFSERDGWAHLYLYDLAGRLKGQITSGPWVVRDVLHVDPATRTLTFTAGGVDPQRNPYHRHVHRIGFDGTGLETLTPEDAEHLVTVAPSGCCFVDVFGRVDTPSVSVVRDADGRVRLALEHADVADLLAAGFRYPTPFTARAADGLTKLHGLVYLPSDFDVRQTYPVLDAIYGWSQLTVTPHAFLLDTGAPVGLHLEIAAENYFVPQSIAELGFIVVVLDGRGTPYRSRAFRDPAYTDPALLTGLADHVAAIRQLAEHYPSMDLNRVGVFGHSGGGHNAAKAILCFPDFFKVAVASAGAHDLRTWHAAWAEMWSRDPERLAAASVATHAAGLRGKLLLAHGDMDENVHPLQTYRLIDALIKANKDFDLLWLPNRHHDFTLDPYFVRRRWDYFVRHLLGLEPPAGIAVNPGSWDEGL